MKPELNITEKQIIQDILQRQIDFDNLSELEQAEQVLTECGGADADALLMLDRVKQILEYYA